MALTLAGLRCAVGVVSSMDQRWPSPLGESRLEHQDAAIMSIMDNEGRSPISASGRVNSPSPSSSGGDSNDGDGAHHTALGLGGLEGDAVQLLPLEVDIKL